MIVSDPLIVVVGHTGIPDGIYTHLNQSLHMTVKKFGGIAHRVWRDRVLAFEVEFSRGFGGENHFKVQFCEKLVPKRKIFIHIKPEGDPNAPPKTGSAAFALHGPEFLVFVTGQVRQLLLLFT